MVCKEEVFHWFKELSGAKRIELMCGLMSMCIPLEIRFFESIIKELAKKDMNALREAELKANSFAELDTICKCDLLADIAVTDSANDMTPNAPNCEMQSNAIQTNCSLNTTVQSIPQPLHQSSQPTLQVMPIQDMTAVAANGSALLAANEMMALAPPPTPSPPNASSNLSQLPSRSKLIVSLCLLSPTNRSCSTIAFKALRNQLTGHQIGGAVSRSVAFGKSLYELEDLFSGLLLLLTMAVHSPAFSYEQRDLLSKQKEEVELTIEGIKNAHFRQNPNYPANAHPFQTYAAHPNVHPVHAGHSHLHPHIGAHSPHTQSPGVSAGGQAAHSHTHSHQNVGQLSVSGPHPTHQNAQQFAYMPAMPVNMSYTTTPLPNMSNLRISNMTSPVSTPSPTNSPSSSKSTVTSVAAISPLPMSTDFVTHGIVPMSETAPIQASYVLTTGIPHQTPNQDMSCAKTIVSCYNCGSVGHRGDECTAQTPEEANR